MRGKRNLKILCVDDEPAIRNVIEILLQRDGHAVDMASDGLLAWNLLSGDLNAYDVVVTDNEMPNLSGLALVERIRAHGYAGKVVMFSGSIVHTAQERLKAFEISAVVPKGEPLELLREIRRLAAG